MKGSAKYSTYELRLRAVQAIESGMPMSMVTEAYQIHRTTLYRWWCRYLDSNEVGLERKAGSGRPRIFSEIDKELLLSIILDSATNFGFESDLWTCRRIQDVLRTNFGLQISRWTIWRRLKESGLTYQMPEKQYMEASEDERRYWRRYELPKIKRAVRKYRGILYFQDESNICLGALLGKTWSPKGHTPKQKMTGARGSVSAMSAISGIGSLVFKLHEKRICSSEVIDFLSQMLKHHSTRHLVVVLDRAPPHTSKKTKNFIANNKRLHVFYLPRYSPDWNPDEKLWNYLKHEELTGHQAKSKEELKKLAGKKLSKLSKSPEKLRGIFFRCYVADLLH